MKKIMAVLFLSALMLACQKESNLIDKEFRGLQLQNDHISAQFWIQGASDAKLKLYDQEKVMIKELPLISEGSLWSVQAPCPANATFYTLAILRDQEWVEDSDPWARAVSANGEMGALVDFEQTNPVNWEEDQRVSNIMHPVIYEVQVRDFSMDPKADFDHPGKFLAFTERDQKMDTEAIGLDHLIEMGVTHVHLMPFYDFSSIDELADVPPYNWGYDPHHYNAVEGTFASQAEVPELRIRECKAMIQALHQSGIGVIMDVVYNHTSGKGKEVFDHIAPGYFFRKRADGSLSNASACGNETASEQEEMRHFMLQSLKFWAEEYHIDGFRFDLMAIHDIETMRQIEQELKGIYPEMLLYGEGWKAGESPLADADLLLKCNTAKVEHIAAFSDEFRNGLKGNVFEESEAGFVGGNASAKENIKFGLAAACAHPQINPLQLSSNDCGFWAANPNQCIAYASCHDNHTLYDKLAIALPEATHEELIVRAGLAQGLVLTGLGIPFLHSGGEMGRTKQGVENSFESPDSINQLNWNLKGQEKGLVEWVKALIQLRKESEVWSMNHPLNASERIVFLPTSEQTLSYELKDKEARTAYAVLVQIDSASVSTPPSGQLVLSWPIDSKPGRGLGMWIYESP